MPALLASKPVKTLSMPAETQQWLIGYMCSLQQPISCRRIRAGLILRLILWMDGNESMAIPGYDNPPAECPGTGAPRGWSLKSFALLAWTAREQMQITYTGSRRP